MSDFSAKLRHLRPVQANVGDLWAVPDERAALVLRRYGVRLIEDEHLDGTGLSGELDVAMLSLVLHYSPSPARALSEVGRVVRKGGRVLVVDMLPHDREEYQQQMGHVWLGFSDKQLSRFLNGAGFGEVRVRMLPADPDAKGPALFAAIAVKQ